MSAFCDPGQGRAGTGHGQRRPGRQRPRRDHRSAGFPQLVRAARRHPQAAPLDVFKITIFGRMESGKSTFLNLLLADVTHPVDLGGAAGPLPTADLPCSPLVTTLVYSPVPYLCQGVRQGRQLRLVVAADLPSRGTAGLPGGRWPSSVSCCVSSSATRRGCCRPSGWSTPRHRRNARPRPSSPRRPRGQRRVILMFSGRPR